ncbi:hypothetical protein Taro_044550 [Colocasia esculenta]|uniref:HMA domain-containing protein n=1 Tax=Colocasia esculenta TaxID=4460 RepID=A0A843X118_COLES|nr:hypothetical protein [Colocasia esculenta]
MWHGCKGGKAGGSKIGSNLACDDQIKVLGGYRGAIASLQVHHKTSCPLTCVLICLLIIHRCPPVTTTTFSLPYLSRSLPPEEVDKPTTLSLFFIVISFFFLFLLTQDIYLSLSLSLSLITMKSSRTRGFMCQPHTSTVVCVPGDLRSVVAPRRPDRTLVEHARIVDLKYSRLVDSPRFETYPVREDKLLQLATVSTSTARDKRRLEMAMVPVTAKTAPAQTASAAVRTERNLRLPTLPSSRDHVFQVVVMRVSLHCQGCAGKVKKHISKMEGVTYFSIDLESKRVTVMGHVSPAVVLESISKVKKAEFWPSTSTPEKTNTSSEVPLSVSRGR